MKNESMIERMDRLERALTIQVQMIGQLTTAVKGHQMCIQAFAKILNMELVEQPAAPSPAAN